MPLVLRADIRKSAPLTPQERVIARAVVSALGTPLSTADWRAVRDALTRRDLASLIAACGLTGISDSLRDLAEPFADIMRASARLGAAQVGLRASSLASVDPFIVTAAQAQCGLLVREVDLATRRAINELMVAGWSTQSLTVDDLARVLRAGIGLTSRQARAVQSTYRGVRDAAIEAGQTKRAAVEAAERAAERSRRRWIKHRAETIARTETLTAANTGRFESWSAASRSGLVPPGTEKQWITAPEESRRGRPCPVCLPRNGVRIPWDQPWPDGRQMPPAHPRCRCTAVMRRARLPEGVHPA